MIFVSDKTQARSPQSGVARGGLGGGRPGGSKQPSRGWGGVTIRAAFVRFLFLHTRGIFGGDNRFRVGDYGGSGVELGVCRKEYFWLGEEGYHFLVTMFRRPKYAPGEGGGGTPLDLSPSVWARRRPPVGVLGADLPVQ